MYRTYKEDKNIFCKLAELFYKSLNSACTEVTTVWRYTNLSIIIINVIIINIIIIIIIIIIVVVVVVTSRCFMIGIIFRFIKLYCHTK